LADFITTIVGFKVFGTQRIEAALDQAKRAAKGRDVKIGGGVSTVQQYLRAGLIDDLHFALSPVVLGKGEAMYAGIDLPSLGYRVTEHHATEQATHCSDSMIAEDRVRAHQRDGIGSRLTVVSVSIVFAGALMALNRFACAYRKPYPS
jgi:hypothetical protein